MIWLDIRGPITRQICPARPRSGYVCHFGKWHGMATPLRGCSGAEARVILRYGLTHAAAP